MATIGERRFRTQRLTGPRFKTVGEVVSFLGAVQAQDYAGAKWAVAQRAAKLTDADLDAALDSGAIFRTHIMRPTWHFVMPEDIRWMLALTSHRVHALSAPYHRKQGLDAKILSTFHGLLGKALEGGGNLTKAEIVKLASGTTVPADPFTLSFAIMHAELEGLIASGPRRGRQHTWALLDERAPPQPSVPKDEALARLARRYFTSHGPAEDKDMAWWSGLTLRDVRAGISLAGEALKREEFDGRTMWSAADEPASVRSRPLVHLLPNYDEVFIAYRDRSDSFDAARFERPAPGSFFDRHLVSVGGFIVGAWRLDAGRSGGTLDTKLLVTLGEEQRVAMAGEVERLSRFQGVPVTWTESVVEGDIAPDRPFLFRTGKA